MRDAVPWVLALVCCAVLGWRSIVHTRDLIALRLANVKLKELERLAPPPFYNHTRADGPYDPCPECSLRQRQRAVLGLEALPQ